MYMKPIVNIVLLNPYIYIYIYIYISKVKLVTVVEGNLKATLSIATTPKCKGERYSIPRIAPLYPWSIPYSAECLAKRHQVPFFESLVWLDLRLNPGLPDHWQTTVLMSRVFANGMGDRGSILHRVIPKTQKMVLDTALLNTQHYKVRIKGKVEQSRERSSALPYTSL